MAITAVYVTIEDDFFALPTANTGRSVYLAILCDRGPHNRVVEINNVSQFRRLFGPPNWDRTNIGHYLVEQALKFTQKVYVVRSVYNKESGQENDDINYTTLSNVSVVYNNVKSAGMQEQVYGKFLFSNVTDIIDTELAKRVYCDQIGYEAFNVGDKILSTGDLLSNAGTITAKYVDIITGNHYLVLDSQYRGISSVDSTNNNLLYSCGFTIEHSSDKYTYNGNNIINIISEVTPGSLYNATTHKYVFPFGLGGAGVGAPKGNIFQVTNYTPAVTGNPEQFTVLFKSALDPNAELLSNPDYPPTNPFCFTIDNAGSTGYYVWYSDLGDTFTDPLILNRQGIKVVVNTTDTAAIIANNTKAAIDSVLTGYVIKSTVGADTELTITGITSAPRATPFYRLGLTDILFAVVHNGVSPVNAYYNITHNSTNPITYTTSDLNVGENFYTYSISNFSNVSVNLTYAGTANQYFPNSILVPGYTYNFVNGSNHVTNVTQGNIADEVKVDDYICLVANPSDSYQIAAINNHDLILTQPYTGTTSLSPTQIDKKEPSSILVSSPNISSEEDISVSGLWTFYAVGAGKFYNNIFLHGEINTALDRMYTYEKDIIINGVKYLEGTSMYPNMFMNLSVRQKNDDGSITSLEGPWQVSLAHTVPSNNGTANIIRDLNSGSDMYLATVINSNSDFIRCIEGDISSITPVTSTDISGIPVRADIQNLFKYGSATTPINSGIDITGLGVYLGKGQDGILFTDSGVVNLFNDKISGMGGVLTQTYSGQLIGVDNSVSAITEILYPQFQIDYVVCGGYPQLVQNAASTLSGIRNDCMCLADIGDVGNAGVSGVISTNKGKAADLTSRVNTYNFNNWNTMLYGQFRQIGSSGPWFTPVYHALERHLSVDDQYWIAEPVAGIEKGNISDPITLRYTVNKEVDIQDLMDAEINCTISEPDGKYFLTQFTTWKRLSVLKRAHAVKFVQFVRKSLPPLLKDILQRKATPFWTSVVDNRIKGFMQPYLAANGRWAAITSFSSSSKFDEARSEIDVALTIKPIRAIESINVSIIVT